MITIQTAQSTNEVNFIIKGKFIKYQKKYFILTAKDSYLELLSCDFKETIYVQNTFLKIIFLQLLEGKDHDKFIIVDDKLNFRILKFDQTFVECCFIGNLYSKKLKLYSKIIKLKKNEQIDKIQDEYHKYINICKSANSFLISIENFLYVKKIKINESENYKNKSELKYFSENRKICFNHIQKKNIYEFIKRKNKYFKQKDNKKCLHTIVKEDNSSHIYKIKKNKNIFLDPNINNKHSTYEYRNIINSIDNESIFYKIIKNEENGFAFFKFLKNIAFITYIEWKHNDFNYLKWWNKIKKKKNTSIDYRMYERYANYNNTYICRKIQNNSKNKYDKNNENIINFYHYTYESEAENGNHNCMFTKKINKIIKNKHICRFSNNILYIPTKQIIQKEIKWNLIPIRRINIKNSVKNIIKKGNWNYSKFKMCNIFEKTNKKLSYKINEELEYYHDEYIYCTNFKIIFLVHFLKTNCTYYGFIKNVIFYSMKINNEILSLKKRLFFSKNSNNSFFKKKDISIVKKYKKEYYKDVNYLNIWSKQIKKIKIIDFINIHNVINSYKYIHDFNTCLVCQYFFNKFIYLMKKYNIHNDSKNNMHKYITFKNASFYYEQQEINIFFLFNIMIRIKLLLFYFIILFYSGNKTFNTETICSFLILRRKTQNPKILYEILIHLYFLNVFFFHILNFLFTSDGANYDKYENIHKSENTYLSKIRRNENRHEHIHNITSEQANNNIKINYCNDSKNETNTHNNEIFLVHNRLSLLTKFLKFNSIDAHLDGKTSEIKYSICFGQTFGENIKQCHTNSKKEMSLYYEQLKIIIINTIHLHFISLKLLDVMKFNYCKICKKFYSKSSEKWEKKKKINKNNIQLNNDVSKIIVIAHNENNEGNIMFLKVQNNMGKNKRLNFEDNSNDILEYQIIPKAKLKVPLNVVKIEKIMNNILCLFTKKGIFLFSFSDTYGANITLTNYYIYNYNDIQYIYKFEFFKIIKKTNYYKEVKTNILFSDFYSEANNLNHFINMTNNNTDEVIKSCYELFYILKKKKLMHYDKESLNNTQFKFRNNFFKSFKYLKNLNNISYLDSFYLSTFEYNYKFNFFEKMFKRNFSMYYSSMMYISFILDIEESGKDKKNVNNINKDIDYTNFFYKTRILKSRKKIPLQNKSVEFFEKKKKKNEKYIPNYNKFYISLEISKNNFTKLYETNGQYGSENEKVLSENEKILSEKYADTSSEHSSHFRNTNVKDRKEKCLKKQNLSQLFTLPDITIVQLDTIKMDNKIFAHTLFNIRYLVIDYEKKTIHLIFIVYNYKNNRILIYRNNFEEYGFYQNEKIFFKNIFLQAKSVFCLTSRNNVIYKKTKEKQFDKKNINKLDNCDNFDIDRPYKNKQEIKESILLILKQEKSDLVIVVKSFVLFNKNKQLYMFKSFLNLFYAYNKIKSIKDYKYKSKIINNNSNIFQHDTFTELQKIQNIKNEPNEYLKNKDNNSIFEIKKVKKNLGYKLFIVDKNNNLYKIMAGYSILLGKDKKKKNCGLQSCLNTAYKNSNFCNSSFFFININKYFNILCISNYFKTIFSFILCDNICNYFEDSILLSKKFSEKLASQEKKNNNSKKINKINKINENTNRFYILTNEEIKKLNFLPYKILFTKSIHTNGDIIYIIFLNHISIRINKYRVCANTDQIISFIDFFEIEFENKSIVNYYYQDNFLCLSYTNNTVDLFYIDFVNNQFFLLKSVNSSSPIYSIYLLIRSKSRKKTDKNIGKQNDGKTDKPEINFLDMDEFQTDNHVIVCLGKKRQCEIFVYYLGKKYKYDNINGTNSYYMFRENKEMNIKMEKEKYNEIIICIKNEHNFIIDTLNDQIKITNIIKLNSFILIGTNIGVVKVYDIFNDMGLEKYNKLYLNNFLFCKTQKIITKVYDEFLLGNGCVNFINIEKVDKNKIQYNDEKNHNFYYPYKKNAYVPVFCENNLYIFLSSIIKSYKSNGNHKFHKNDYTTKLAKKLDYNIASLLNIKKKYINNKFFKLKNIGSNIIKNKNIFLIPLKICINNRTYTKKNYTHNSNENELAGLTTIDGNLFCNILKQNGKKYDENYCENEITELSKVKTTNWETHSFKKYINNKVVKAKNYMSPNNIILIKNNNKNDFIFLIIISINNELKIGLIKKSILCFPERSYLDNLKIHKFVEGNTTNEFSYYFKNGIIYSRQSHEKNDIKISQSLKNMNKSGKKKTVCNYKYIGCNLGKKGNQLKFGKSIIHIHKNQNIKNIFHLNLDRNYILKEAFQICIYKEREDIINWINEKIKDDKKDQSILNLFNSLKDKKKKKYINNKEKNDKKQNNLLYIYNNIFLKDNNIFVKNKHILYLLRDKYINFKNHIYSFLFFIIIILKYKLASFFQNELIQFNLFIKGYYPYDVEQSNISKEFEKKEKIYKSANKICKMLNVLFFLKEENPNINNTDYDLTYLENNYPTHKKRNNVDKFISLNEDRSVKNSNKNIFVKRQKMLKDLNCDNYLENPPIFNKPYKEMNKKNRLQYTNNNVELDKISYDPINNEYNNENHKRVCKLIIKEMNFVRNAERMNMHFRDIKNGNKNNYKLTNLEVNQFCVSNKKEYDEKNKRTLVQNLNFVILHIIGSKYNFSNIVEYYKIINCKNKIFHKKIDVKFEEEKLSELSNFNENKKFWKNRKKGYIKIMNKIIEKKKIYKILQNSNKINKNMKKEKNESGNKKWGIKRHFYRYRNIFKKIVENLNQYKEECAIKYGHKIKNCYKYKNLEKKKMNKNNINNYETYDCLFVYINSISYKVKNIAFCNLKNNFNKKFNLLSEEIYFIMQLIGNYAYLINFRTSVSFWINIKYLNKNIYILKLSKKNKNKKIEKMNENINNKKNVYTYDYLKKKEIDTNLLENTSKKTDIFMFKKIKRENIVNLFYKNVSTNPIIYINRNMKNIGIFLNKYIIYTQKNKIILLKIIISEDNRNVVNHKNKDIENIFNSYNFFENKYINNSENSRKLNFSDLYKNFIKNDKIINRYLEDSGNNEMTEMEYLRSLIIKKKRRIENARRNMFINNTNENNRREQGYDDNNIIDQNINNNSNSNENRPGFTFSPYNDQIYGSYRTNIIKSRIDSILGKDRINNKQEYNFEDINNYVFDNFFNYNDLKFLKKFKYGLIEFCNTTDNFEDIVNMKTFENRIIIITKNYIKMYEYDELKNIFLLRAIKSIYGTILCLEHNICNSFIKNNIINFKEKNKMSLFIFNNIIDYLNVVCKNYLFFYKIAQNNMINIATIKFKNNIHILCKNKLFYNIVGFNLNINKRECITESFRKYINFYENFYLVDEKCNIYNMYIYPLKQNNRNCYFDQNRNIEICYDLMIFLQILIEGKKCKKKLQNWKFTDYFTIKKQQKDMKKKKKKQFEKNIYYYKYIMKDKHKKLLSIFIDRVLIYMNKKIIFFRKLFEKKSKNIFEFELKLKIFNRLLKLCSYKFYDKKNGVELLNNIYDQKRNKNITSFSIINRKNDYIDIIHSQLGDIGICSLQNSKFQDGKISTLNNCIPDSNMASLSNNLNISKPIKNRYLKTSNNLLNFRIGSKKWKGGNIWMEKFTMEKINEMNKYRIYDINSYNDVIKNNIKDNTYYDADYYYLLVQISNCDNILNCNNGIEENQQTNIRRSKILNKYIDFIYLHFLINISYNPNIFYHIKKYLHLHSYSAKNFEKKNYYINIDLLNIIFNFDKNGLKQLKTALTIFPTNPTIEELFDAVSSLSIPLNIS
ncbi:conserved Plasmodium protein, unknown function [Plasmodium berghei]|uniref:Uncharacterized protein n=2 Tax=Plasmodium berghei TaxID=5821 RepID=A0A509AIV2_PLABA|nr:conserved Plasmodium protein, unknown function [Plasmodium berghei ANKA]CXI34246.1 conserved Plasmodium protein, unknown function [Plasmodium berghei]SCM21362.1 conserved Plasmodium protein, unknown function [Plasmodium berghei]SCN24618.1 conserved Plasmodium protein, unknown function [Plasmodium berghei]SCO59778.1 conserved Plasmodium protein, unknown function [Plasmodium berghei]SCO61036.1 conserved Plasmodium protein, unknown function [Plasmodium berghei]|eukprot:XP_034421209.1 conserved Plasmodium protein, unknown function [Plasmodium berghei ANKA]